MFDFSKEQMNIKNAAREFAEGEFLDIAFDQDDNEAFPEKVWKQACEYGFIGSFIDEKYNGGGLGVTESALIMEEFWRVDPGCGSILLATLGAEIINDYGSEKQKHQYLSLAATGETVMGSVPGEDYALDAFFYEKISDDEYVLNGSSPFVTNGSSADHLVIVAQENLNPGKYSAFIVDCKSKGVNSIKLSDKLGLRAFDIGSVRLENVKIYSAHRIGQEGSGRQQLASFLERISLYNSAQALGVAQGCMEKAIQYARQRVQFGHAIGRFQLIQFKIAEMATRIEAARDFCYSAARQFDSGKKDIKLICMASWFAREAAAIATSETLQIHGGYGYMKELDIERFYRDVQFLEIFGASRDKEKITLAEKLLGRMQ